MTDWQIILLAVAGWLAITWLAFRWKLPACVLFGLVFEPGSAILLMQLFEPGGEGRKVTKLRAEHFT